MSDLENERVEMLTRLRDRAARLTDSMDKELNEIRGLAPRQAVDRALGLGIMLPFISAKLLEVQGWFRNGHPVSAVDAFGHHSLAADLRQIADALEIAGNRAEEIQE